MKRQGGGNRETFTVRKNSNGIGVEKTWPLHSPIVDKIEVVRHGKVTRAKLNLFISASSPFVRLFSIEYPTTVNFSPNDILKNAAIPAALCQKNNRTSGGNDTDNIWKSIY